MVGQEHMSLWRETAPIVWERFTRLAIEVEIARNEKDNARVMEAEA